jgi:hypothetical protein
VSFRRRKHRLGSRRDRTPGDVEQTTSAGSISEAEETGQ